MTPKQAVDHFGGYAALSRALTDAGHPVSRQAVHKWVRKGWIPDERVHLIRELMEGGK